MMQPIIAVPNIEQFFVLDSITEFVAACTPVKCFEYIYMPDADETSVLLPTGVLDCSCDSILL